MKKIQFLAVATLVSTILGGVAVSAAEPGKGPQDLDTTTHVKFVQDDNGGEGGEQLNLLKAQKVAERLLFLVQEETNRQKKHH